MHKASLLTVIEMLVRGAKPAAEGEGEDGETVETQRRGLCGKVEVSVVVKRIYG